MWGCQLSIKSTSAFQSMLADAAEYADVVPTTFGNDPNIAAPATAGNISLYIDRSPSWGLFIRDSSQLWGTIAPPPPLRFLLGQPRVAQGNIARNATRSFITTLPLWLVRVCLRFAANCGRRPPLSYTPRPNTRALAPLL